jgi:DNA invertase Pin-like site-specific DNA recombinase
LLSFPDELHLLGIDTATPAGKAMFQACGVFTELERSIIRERINAGLARAGAWSNGKKSGRPILGAISWKIGLGSKMACG